MLTELHLHSSLNQSTFFCFTLNSQVALALPHIVFPNSYADLLCCLLSAQLILVSFCYNPLYLSMLGNTELKFYFH